MIKLSKKYQKLIKTPEQIQGIRKAGELNTAVLDLVQEKIREGMSTQDIDVLVAEFTERHGGICAPLNYSGFPKHCCTSINEVVCHGIPSEEEILMDGDIINVDVTTILNGYYADASRMFMIGSVEPEIQHLVEVARECMELGAKACKPFGFVGDQAKVITEHAHRHGYTVVRDLCGHGTGNHFHEDPEMDHYYSGRKGMQLLPGMVFTIEPMINMGSYECFIDEEDGWTVVTDDELPSAQWEHTFFMTDNGLEIITH